MSKRFFFLFLFFTLSLTTAIAKFPPESAPTTIQGKITDLNTKRPIAETKVDLFTFNQKIIASTLANSQGEYRIKASIPLGYYSLKASKESCVSQGTIRFLQIGKTYTINFSLERIPNLPPKIIRIRPKDNSTFLAGANIKIKIYAFDPGKDPLEYQFSVSGAIKQRWSNSNTYIWQTTTLDTGPVEIKCEVRDIKGVTVSKAITYRIINPTAEEILKKAVDNYAEIFDFKANMTLSSTLNGQPFGKTEYCRYYFKAPNKEKTETYSDSYRAKKTDIIIINGSTMHLIDPVNNIKQEVDLLADAGMNATQFSQMDIYYNQNLFLSQHSVTRNDSNSDLNNMIITLDAIPNIPNNIYDKLSISIDYTKGIVYKYSIFRNNESNQLELVQETKTIESKQMPNTAWVSKKMTKTPNLTSGNLISTLTYNNLQINTGLTDLDFDPTKQY